MSDVLNPVQIETSIRDVANRMAKGVQVCSDRYGLYLETDHAHDLAYARAYMAHDGAAHEKKYAATLATESERSARDAADVAYRHADRTARALEAELRAWQSIGASVRSMYGVAGRGEGA